MWTQVCVGEGRNERNRESSINIYMLKSESRSVVSDSLQPHGLQPMALPSMGFSRQEYWSGCHFCLQGIFLTQGLNTGLPHCREMLYCLSHQGSTKRIFVLIHPLHKAEHLSPVGFFFFFFLNVQAYLKVRRRSQSNVCYKVVKDGYVSCEEFYYV